MEMRVLSTLQAKNIVDVAVDRLAEYIFQNGLKGVTTGISGGINSAVVSAVAIRAIDRLNAEGYPCDYHFAFLDVQSDPFDLERARAHAEVFGYDLQYVDLNPGYHAMRTVFSNVFPWESSKVAKANLKCRLRMVTLYEIAGNNGYIYLDTDDYPEMQMGFWTLKGDEGDLKLFQLITKTEFYDLGAYLGVPEIILNSEPGDGLGVTPGSKASDQLGLFYDQIEYVLSRMIGAGWKTEMRPEHDGSMPQLEVAQLAETIDDIAAELGVPRDNVVQVLVQNQKTTFKREGVQLLLKSRSELGLHEVGTTEFSNTILRAIKAQQTV